jgi:tripartite-type tricarboxylate transporter receptor subunit TctC
MMKRMTRKWLAAVDSSLFFGIALLACMALLLHCLPAVAQDFPARPIKFVVPFPPGSGTDVTARFYARELALLAGQPVIVENKPGANGFVAVSNVLAGPADGYTVLVGGATTFATNAALFRTLPYDPAIDLSPLSMLMGTSVVLLVPANSRYKTLADLIDDAQKRPDALNYASGAASYQLMSEWFNKLAQIKTRHVPYKGAPDAARAVMSGEVDFTLVDTSAGLTALQGGRVRALAVASNQRLKGLPNVPTGVEGGLHDFITYLWVGAAVPAKTPKQVVDRLAAWMGQVAERPQTREFLERIGMEVMPIGPDAFRKFQQDNITLWKRVAKSANIEPQ